MLESLSNYYGPMSLVLGALVGVSLVTRVFRLPILASYLLTGFFVSRIVHIDTHGSTFTLFQQIAFTILIFLVGIELSWKRVHEYIVTSSRVSLSLIAISIVGGLGIGTLIGLSSEASLILGLCLACTSGIASIKILTDAHDTNSLHGRLTISNLFVQDVFAILCLTILAGYLGRDGLSVGAEVALIAIRAAAITCILWYLSRTALAWLFKQFKESGEMSLLICLAWCFLGTFAIRSLDIPLEAGALITGLTLAGSPYALEITARMRSIRDILFIGVFFVFGSNVTSIPTSYIALTVIGIIFMVLIRPAITYAGLILLGYRNRPSISTALFQAPMSEYALLFALMGLRSGIAESKELASVISLITMASMLVGSIYSARKNDIIQSLSPRLRKLERGRHRSRDRITGGARDNANHVILFGYHRMGFHILKELQKLKQDVVVVDFNPEIVSNLRKAGVQALYGDVEDETIYEAADITKATTVISTIPLHEETRYLLKIVRTYNPKAAVVVTAKQAEEAMKYYEEGADYVLMPHITASSHLASLLHGKNNEGLKQKLQALNHAEVLKSTMQQPLYEG